MLEERREREKYSIRPESETWTEGMRRIRFHGGSCQVGVLQTSQTPGGGILEGFCSSPGARQEAVEIDY